MSFPPHLPPGVEAIDTTGDASSKNPKSPLKLQQMVYLESESRPKFDVFAKVLAESTSSSVLSQEAWNERVFIVKHWDTGATVNGEVLNVSAFRRAYPTGYPLTKKLYVTTNSTGVSHLWLRDLSTPDPDKPEKTKGDRMLAHTAQMFDIIKFVHVKLSMHLKSDRTWNTIKDSYANIPRKLVAKYVKLCPICSGKCPVVHPPKGAIKPILSDEYRDRFQLDLIDYQNDPQSWPDDETGTKFHFLLVIKDHFTRFIVGHELETKSAHLVARAIYKIYSIIGYPLIQHTDNGKEFVAAEVTRLLHEISPSSRTLTGRPRTPRDQGSVERSNGAIKNCLGSGVQDEILAGTKDASWLTEYPRVFAGLNASSNRSDGLSAYFMLFGMNYLRTNFNTTTQSEIEDKDSIPERCVKEGPDFENKMIFLDEITSKEIRDFAVGKGYVAAETAVESAQSPPKALLSEFNEEDDTKPSSREVVNTPQAAIPAGSVAVNTPTTTACTAAAPNAPMEVSPCHTVKDDEKPDEALECSSTSGASKAKVSEPVSFLKDPPNYPASASLVIPPAHLKNDDSSEDEVVTLTKEEIASLPAASEGPSKRCVREEVPLQLTDAFKNCIQKRPLVDGALCDCVFPTLSCSQCVFPHSSKILSLFDESYRNLNMQTKRWWETDFINTYCQLLAHNTHSSDKLFVSLYHPNEIIRRQHTRRLRGKCGVILTVANKGNQHFAAIKFDVRLRQITVLDGYAGVSKGWAPHIMNILKRCRLVSLDTTSSQALHFLETEMSFDTQCQPCVTWQVQHRALIHQPNPYDCGPIACMIIRLLLSGFDISTIPFQDYRRCVVTHYFDLFTEHETELSIVRVLPSDTTPNGRPSRAKNGQDLPTPELEVTCPICLQELDDKDIYKTPCKHDFHLQCLLNGIFCSSNTACPLCRSQLPDELTEDLQQQPYLSSPDKSAPSIENYLFYDDVNDDYIPPPSGLSRTSRPSPFASETSQSSHVARPTTTPSMLQPALHQQHQGSSAYSTLSNSVVSLRNAASVSTSLAKTKVTNAALNPDSDSDSSSKIEDPDIQHMLRRIQGRKSITREELMASASSSSSDDDEDAKLGKFSDAIEDDDDMEKKPAAVDHHSDSVSNSELEESQDQGKQRCAAKRAIIPESPTAADHLGDGGASKRARTSESPTTPQKCGDGPAELKESASYPMTAQELFTGVHPAGTQGTPDAKAVFAQNKYNLRMRNNEVNKKRQLKQAESMKRAFRNDNCPKIGDMVCVRVDKRDQSKTNSRGVQGVVYEVNSITKGIRVASEHGILIKQGSKEGRWVSFADYNIRDYDVAVCLKLRIHRDAVRSGTFDPTQCGVITTAKAHQEEVGGIMFGKRSCGCKKPPFCTTRRCTCVQFGHMCNSSCKGCGGNCQHALNMLRLAKQR